MTTKPWQSSARQLLIFLILLTLYRLWVVSQINISLYVDEAQYWTWSQALDWGYFSKPPLIAALIAVCTQLFGNSVLAVKLAGILCYPLTAWVIFRLGEALFDRRTGVLASFSFSLIPFVSGLGLFVSTDAPLLLCWALSLLCFYRATQTNLWRYWLGLGLALGLGLLAKYTQLALLPCLFAWLVWDARHPLKNPRLYIALAIAVVCLLPNILWNAAHDFPTLHHTADITHLEGGNTKSGNLGETLGAQLGSLGPLLLIGWLLALGRWRDPSERFLHFVSLPLLGLVCLQAWRSEANGNWGAPCLIAFTLLASRALSTRQNLRWWWAALACNALIMLAVYHYHQPITWQLIGQTQPKKPDFLKRARGWPQLAAQLRPLMQAHPEARLLVNDRTLAAHLLYELRDLSPTLLAWAPFPRAHDHYQLSRPLRADDKTASQLYRQALSYPLRANDKTSTYLFVRQDGIAPLHFAQQTQIAQLRITTPQISREASVWLVSGFQGY